MLLQVIKKNSFFFLKRDSHSFVKWCHFVPSSILLSGTWIWRLEMWWTRVTVRMEATGYRWSRKTRAPWSSVTWYSHQTSLRQPPWDSFIWLGKEKPLPPPWILYIISKVASFPKSTDRPWYENPTASFSPLRTKSARESCFCPEAKQSQRVDYVHPIPEFRGEGQWGNLVHLKEFK